MPASYWVLTGFYTSDIPLFLSFSQFLAPTNGDLSGHSGKGPSRDGPQGRLFLTKRQ